MLRLPPVAGHQRLLQCFRRLGRRLDELRLPRAVGQHRFRGATAGADERARVLGQPVRGSWLQRRGHEFGCL